MSYQVLFAGSARRDLDKLPESVRAAVLEFAVGPLAANPHRVGKALVKERSGYHSVRRGEYRIILGVQLAARVIAQLWPPR